MRKKFNDTGLCVPRLHYMADISGKISQIVRLVEQGEYFTINRPRQYGKTTVLSLLAKELNQRRDYLALKISFEELDTDTYKNAESFVCAFLHLLIREFQYLGLPELSDFTEKHTASVKQMPDLSGFITKLVRDMVQEKSTVLLIDEVDKSSNNQLFLDFLGMLRNKYLHRNEEKDHTFHSVILAGVHDVKSLKAKIRPDDERKYNSPWNIAADFTVDMSLNPEEIGTMLKEYSSDKGIQPDIPAIAEKLYYYTSGYPYLVSKLCKFIDEQIVPPREDKNWSVADADEAFAMIVREKYTTTLFDSMAKNLENSPDLYENVFQIVINGKRIPFNISVPVIHLGYLYGIFTESDEYCKIHNRIFEQRIYSYMTTKLLTSEHEPLLSPQPEYYMEDGLNLRLILVKFQTFMKEHHSHKDQKFLEREGRLLFLSFLRPIINGKGFEFKEPNVSDERRMDIVITYKNRRYVLELKRWYGPKAHQEGLQQLSDYLDMFSLKEGYLLIYDFSKNREYKQEDIVFQDKRIFAVWV
ncbi:MAG: AAA-like domain-containing protein [Desulfococcaceae bacterium]